MEIYALLLLILLVPIVCNLQERENCPVNCLKLKKIGMGRYFNKKDIVYFCIFLLLVTVFTFRNFTVGADTSSYKSIYDSFNIKDFKLGKGLELFYTILMIIAKFLNLQYTGVLFIVAIITISIFFSFIRKYSSNPFVSIFFFVVLGVYASGFNGVRQFLALAFFVLAIDGFINKNPFKYFAYCICAFFCHSSAIILLPLYVLRYLKFNWKFVSVTSIISVIVLVLFPTFTKWVSYFTQKNYYEFYIERELFNQALSVYNILYILGFIFVFVFLWYVKKFIKDEREIKIYEIFLMLFYIAVCVRFIATFSGFFMLVNRFTMYFFWSLIILIPLTIKNFFIPKFSKLYKFMVFIFGIIYFFISVVVRESNNIFPYKFVFEKYSLNWFVVVSIILLIILILIIMCNRGYGFKRKKVING